MLSPALGNQGPSAVQGGPLQDLNAALVYYGPGGPNLQGQATEGSLEELAPSVMERGAVRGNPTDPKWRRRPL